MPTVNDSKVSTVARLNQARMECDNINKEMCKHYYATRHPECTMTEAECREEYQDILDRREAKQTEISALLKELESNPGSIARMPIQLATVRHALKSGMAVEATHKETQQNVLWLPTQKDELTNDWQKVHEYTNFVALIEDTFGLLGELPDVPFTTKPAKAKVQTAERERREEARAIQLELFEMEDDSNLKYLERQAAGRKYEERTLAERQESKNFFHKKDELTRRLRRLNNVKIRPFATRLGYSDRDPYEVVKIVSPICVEVRAMDAVLDESWKPEMIPGGFCAHTVNNHSQKWVITPNEKNETIRIRWSEAKGLWQAGKYSPFSMAEKPFKHYDYNF